MKSNPLILLLALTYSLFFAFGCEKEEIDDRPDFIFLGTLTDLTTGEPKTDWQVNFQKNDPPFINRPPIFVGTSFGYDTIDVDGNFEMSVTSYSDRARDGEEWFENDPVRKRTYYDDYQLYFRAPGPYNDIPQNDRNYMVLDPQDRDLDLDSFDFSTKGEVITRNIKVFTGGRGRIRFRYFIQRESEGLEYFTIETTFRDLAFERPYRFSHAGLLGFPETGDNDELLYYPPVGRSVEAVTTFRTIDNINSPEQPVLDSLVLRDTFLIEGPADTLRTRNYSY